MADDAPRTNGTNRNASAKTGLDPNAIAADDGFYFGLGAFETVAIEHGSPVFLEKHLERLQEALDFLGIEGDADTMGRMAAAHVARAENLPARAALKITATPLNTLFELRENRYGEERYRQGFSTAISDIRRNETSPFTYRKTLNYGECILEKRRAKAAGIDEPVFLNTQGCLSEGATSNIFFSDGRRIYTPRISCGILPGIMRGFVCDSENVIECDLTPEDLASFDEMFLTNSLMGIMPVSRLGETRFFERKAAERLQRRYRDLLAGL